MSFIRKIDHDNRLVGNGISYPKEFVQRVIEEYYDRPDICKFAVDGESMLGKYLSSGVDINLSPEQIVEAFTSKNEYVVLKAAEKAVRRRRLHAEWLRLMASNISILDTPPWYIQSRKIRL